MPISYTENSKFATKKWYIIGSESKGNYLPDNEVKFLTSSLESDLCNYADAHILVTGNINITGNTDNDTKVAFKNCIPFKKCRTEINETFVDDAEHINIAMPMYNLIEYSDNYFDTPGSLWQFKSDEIEDVDLTVDHSSSLKYKSSFIGDTDADGVNRKKEDVKIGTPLNYLSNFWRSLEIPLINCKVEFSLEWYENCTLSSSETAATFTIADTELYVPIVTLKI